MDPFVTNNVNKRAPQNSAGLFLLRRIFPERERRTADRSLEPFREKSGGGKTHSLGNVRNAHVRVLQKKF